MDKLNYTVGTNDREGCGRLAGEELTSSVEQGTFLCEEDIMNLIMHSPHSPHRLPRFFRRCSCTQHLLLHVLFSYGERASFTFL